MKVFNTLTRKKEKFKPLEAKKISMYVCGPTVYNYIHIGNARSVIAFDTIRRYFEYRGYEVKYISNFTDVDDKMINEARKENITVPEFADKFMAAYKEDTAALNIEPATYHPRATHEIKDIISFIENLINEGYAYEVNGNVYYRAKKFSHYGELSDQNIDELEEGASKHIDNKEQEEKEDPIDFALWKAQKEVDEIAWDSPWGKGRPGWHIECSVMSTKYLGNTIDIHGGGQDLEFPHHENEIAQSEAETGQKFVNYWLHNGFVTVGKNQEKMSKSLHNFVTVHDILKKVDPQALRFYMSSVQYRRPINYSDDGLKQAKTVLERYKNTLRLIDDRLKDITDPLISEEFRADMDQAEAAFIEAMDDDFNVQNALSVVYELVSKANSHLQKEKVDKEAITKFRDLLVTWVSIFGVDLTSAKEDNSSDNQEIENLIAQRDKARKQKDWAESDRLRDQLKEMGIIIEDSPQGTRWHRA